MSRRKQAKPRFLKHDKITDDDICVDNAAISLKNNDGDDDNDGEVMLKDGDRFDDDDDDDDDEIHSFCSNNEDEEEYDEDYDDDPDLNENTSDSFQSDVFSSHTSSSFSPSLSDGIATPNSLIHHQIDGENPHNGGGGLSPMTVGNKRKKSGEDGINGDIDRNEGGGGIGGGSDGKKIKSEQSHSSKAGKTKASSDGSYHCQFCEKTFPRLGYLKKHEQSHAEHMPFKCEYCARLFKHKRSRDRHTKLHTGDRRYKCPHCEAAFSRSDHLKIHMKTHDNQKPFQCTVCNRGYNTAAALTSHMQNHKKQAALTGNPMLTYSPRSTGSGSSAYSVNHRRNKYSTTIEGTSPAFGPRLSCVYCTKNDFATIDQLNIHIQQMHNNVAQVSGTIASGGSGSVGGGLHSRGGTPNSIPSPSNLSLNCEFCTMKFSSIQGIFQHLKVSHMDRISSPSSYLEHFNRNLMSSYDGYHYRKFKESLIKVEAKTPEMHEKPETPVTPVTPIEKAAKKLDEIKLEKEQESPTDLSQPKVKIGFKEEPNYIINNNNNHHNVNHNNNTVESRQSSPAATGGNFLCNQCSAALPDFESFRAHLKTHLEQGVGSYLCQHCGVAFNDQQVYEKHVFSHFLITTTEHVCPQNCNKNFSKQEDYQKHLLDTHIQQIFRCEMCAEIFDTKVAIQVHLAVAHPNEIKLSRCSSCMEVFRSDREFRHHVRTRHVVAGAIQCIFCRAVCSSELDMHFHLAAHARQFRCPICPESFHVEFLLDRHMQMHHSGKETTLSPKTFTNNNNNNNIDYHHSMGAATAASVAIPKNPYTFSNKFYNQLQIDTLGSKHPNLLHGLYDQMNKSSSRFANENGFSSPNKGLLGLYNHPEMLAKLNSFYAMENGNERYFQSKPPSSLYDSARFSSGSVNSGVGGPPGDQNLKNHLNTFSGSHEEGPPKNTNSGRYHHQSQTEKGFSCGICERNDFNTENEVHTHRKLVHNLKTGVSLRCAYCNGDFRSRSELENHMKITHNTSGKHKCLICDEIFPSPAVLAEHKLTHCKVGPSGRCSHCLIALKDVTFFKSHLAEHNGNDIPVQCICCRQTLNSEFEIGLHAKFHTKSTETKENTCALCLETLPPNVDTRVCESCYKKHNLNLKTQKNYLSQQNGIPMETQCNLCKKIVSSSLKLQEHLIEHTFAGCEDRGYNCYICSAVFTVPAGLQSHMIEHGLNARPYDCSSCTAKFYFRAELDHHTIDHEMAAPLSKQKPKANVEQRLGTSNVREIIEPENLKIELEDIKRSNEECTGDNNEEEEEYIEVDNVDTTEKFITKVENDSDKEDHNKNENDEDIEQK